LTLQDCGLCPTISGSPEKATEREDLMTWAPIPPICLDDLRLVREHKELHRAWSAILSPSGRQEYWAGNALALWRRHDLIAKEMDERGSRVARVAIKLHYSALCLDPGKLNIELDVLMANMGDGTLPPLRCNVDDLRAMLAREMEN